MILFEKVRWKNFLSTGNQFIEINFQTDGESRFAKNFAIGSWATVTLPMPILTLLWFSGAASSLDDEAKKIKIKTVTVI